MAGTRDKLVLGFPEYCPQAEAVAVRLGVPCEIIDVHHFPDGESLVRLPSDLPPEVIICRSLDHPNTKLVELALAAGTARELGARRLTLVAPYLCYMRQDMAFRSGEAVSQRVVGRHLARLFDTVVAVDPHLHRTPRLAQAVPAPAALTVTAAGPIGRFLAQQLDAPLILAPDTEAQQWARAVARHGGLAYGVALKERRGDRQVEVELPKLDLRGRPVVLVDDIASTGRTLAAAARQALARGAREVHAMVVHALFVDDALEHVHGAGVDRLWSTDSITHATNAVELAPLIADALAAARS